jgi:hypothetical protein
MKTIKTYRKVLIFCLLVVAYSLPASSHCDSYDGPLIKDALKAIETEQVTMVMKWIEPEYEEEIKALFDKTVSLKQGDQEIYRILEKYFLETLVRLHRAGEGAPYTGLKPAGSASGIVVMADEAIAEEDIEGLIHKLQDHLSANVKELYLEVAEKRNTKENSVEEGRDYVRAYVVY